MTTTKRIDCQAGISPSNSSFCMVNNNCNPSFQKQYYSAELLIFICAAIVATIARLIVASYFPMTGDEAYYWQWSKHLSLGYHDHPPLIGWILNLWEHIGGDTVFWLRMLMLLLTTATTITIFMTTKHLTNNIAAASYAGTLTLITPLLSLGGLAIIPDIPLLFFWSFALYAFSRAVFSTGAISRQFGICFGYKNYMCFIKNIIRENIWWLICGAAIGGAILSKLSGLLLPVSFFIFLAISHTFRFWLKKPAPYILLGVALLTITPLFLWNANNNWENFVFQYMHRAAPTFTLKRFPGYFFLQTILGFSPVLFLLAIAGWFTSLKKWLFHRNDKILFLLATSAPIHLAALLMAFVQQPGMHWALPGTLSIFILLGIHFTNYETNKRRTSKLFILSIAVSTLISLACFMILLKPSLILSALNRHNISTEFVNKGKKLDSKEIAEFIGYEELGRRVKEIKQKLVTKKHHLLIITTSYTLSSLLAYYSNEPTYVALGSSVGYEYSRWINFSEHLGSDAIYIDFEPFDSRSDIFPIIRNAYESIHPLPPIYIEKSGVPIRTYYPVYCRNLKKDLFSQYKVANNHAK